MICGLCACSSVGVADNIEDSLNSSNHSAGGFDFTLYSNKKTYKTTEAVEIWAELVYTGKEDNITIWSDEPYANFFITDGAEYNAGNAHWLVLKSTVLEKGEVLRSDYKEFKIWYEDMPNAEALKESFNQKELFLPTGKYVITAEADFALSERMGAEKSGLICELEIEVVE